MPLVARESAQPACDDLLHRSITVDASAAGVGLDIPDGRPITLSGRCADAAAPWYALPYYASNWPAAHWVFVPPGSYTLFAGATTTPTFPGGHGTITDGEFATNPAAPREVGLRALIPAGTLPARGACGSPALALNPRAITMIDFFHGFDDVWIPIDGGGDDYRVVEINMNDAFGPSPPISICDGCGPGAACTALPIASIAIGPGGFLHLQDVAVDNLPMAGQVIFDPFDAAAP
jgi:hypothetical protein